MNGYAWMILGAFVTVVVLLIWVASKRNRWL